MYETEKEKKERTKKKKKAEERRESTSADSAHLFTLHETVEKGERIVQTIRRESAKPW